MKNNNVKNSIFIIVATILIVSVLTISFASDKVTTVNNENIEKIGEMFNELDSQEEIIAEVKYIVPIEYTKVSATFGTRVHPITKEEKTHTGIDLVAKEGQEINLAPGWRRITMIDSIKEACGVDFNEITTDEDAVKLVEFELNGKKYKIDLSDYHESMIQYKQER